MFKRPFFKSPAQVVTDRGTKFTFGKLAEYFAQEEIKQCAVSTSQPRAKGQVKWINQVSMSVLANPSKIHPSSKDIQIYYEIFLIPNIILVLTLSLLN